MYVTKKGLGYVLSANIVYRFFLLVKSSHCTLSPNIRRNAKIQGRDKIYSELTLPRKFEVVHSTTTRRSRQIPSVRLAIPILGWASDVVAMVTSWGYEGGRGGDCWSFSRSGRG